MKIKENFSFHAKTDRIGRYSLTTDRLNAENPFRVPALCLIVPKNDTEGTKTLYKGPDPRYKKPDGFESAIKRALTTLNGQENL